MVRILVSTVSCLLLIATEAGAQMVVYPAKGQSAGQQKKDESECHLWAVERSGYDPANPPPAPQANSPKPVTGSGARLRGAVGGAIIGEIADGNAGDAALAGAALGGLRERSRQHRAQQESQNAAVQKQKLGLSNYNKARAACLEGRGYTVK